MSGSTATTSDAISSRSRACGPAQQRQLMRLILNLAGANDDRVRDAVQRLRDDGHQVDVRVAWEGADAVPFAREAAAAGYDVVAAGGGDGTVNAVVRGLLEDLQDGASCGTALAILPFGTANDLATSCGLDPIDPSALLRMLEQSHRSRIDVGRMNGVPFLNVASGGYAAEVTTETDPDLKRVLGSLAYWLTGLTSLGQVVPRPIRLKADDFEWEGRVYAVAVCNGRQAGGGLRLAPKATINDGLFDLAIVPDVSWTEFLDVYADLQRLEYEDRPAHIVSRQAAKIEIDAPEGLQVNLDGEPHRGEHFEFTIEPRRLRCLLPVGCPLVARP